MEAVVHGRKVSTLAQWKAYASQTGPAWVIGALACGPATLASVSKAGAGFGYALVWVVVLSALFGTTAQYLAAKVGIIGRQGLISMVQKEVGSVWAWLLVADGVAVTWIAAVIIMKALAGVTSILIGVDARIMGIFYAVLIPSLLIIGGYKRIELACKALVGFVVLCFIANLAIVRPDVVELLKGLIPTLPGGYRSALFAAGIMGGAVHITIICLHTYTVNARGWNPGDLRLARFDTILSMFVAFGIYSMAIFLSTAAGLHPHGVAANTPIEVAMSLNRLLGSHAMWVFLLGLWGAAFSTLGPVILSIGYMVADKAGWGLEIKDRRVASVLALASLGAVMGPFLKGAFMHLLVVAMALGLTGSLLALTIVLYMLNSRKISGELRNGIWENILGFLTLSVSTVLVVQWVVRNIIARFV